MPTFARRSLGFCGQTRGCRHPRYGSKLEPVAKVRFVQAVPALSRLFGARRGRRWSYEKVRILRTRKR